MAADVALSDQKRRLLENYLRQGAAGSAPASPTMARRPAGRHAPLSLSQEQLVLREKDTPACPALYNECITLRMEGQVEASILQRCLSDIIRRHEIWRTGYDMEDGQLVQVIQAPAGIQLPVIDLRGLSSDEQEDRILSTVGAAVRKPFDLKQGPLLRATLIRLADSELRLFLTAHLSIVDGVSVYQILPSELCALYRAHSSGQPSPLRDLDLQYADYACWQRQFMEGEERTRQVEYWRKQLGYQIPTLNWPCDRIRPHRETFRGTIRSFDLPRELVQAVKAVSHSEGVTLFLTLLAGLVALLHGYTRQEDIIVGTPSSAGRERGETQGLLGYFLTPVALRFDLTERPTFHQLLRQAQRLMLEALSNDDVPLELLAKELKYPPDRSRNPFFAVAISRQPPTPHLDMEWSVTSMDIESGGTPWDLYIAFIDRPQATMARVQYSTDLFESATIERMMAQYLSLLGALASNPGRHVSDVGLLPSRYDSTVAALAVAPGAPGHAE